MEGPLCDTPFCLRQHCEHGSCNTTNEKPYCHCVRGYDGKFCERDIDDCDTPTGNPCQNGGVCMDGINRYDCNCSGTGYYGLLCEMDINECQNSENPCGSQGKCENLPGTYRCSCDDKNKCGHFCELDNPCEHVKPCVEGVCVPLCTDKADYICQCKDNYTGKNCNEYKVGGQWCTEVEINLQLERFWFLGGR